MNENHFENNTEENSSDDEKKGFDKHRLDDFRNVASQICDYETPLATKEELIGRLDSYDDILEDALVSEDKSSIAAYEVLDYLIKLSRVYDNDKVVKLAVAKMTKLLPYIDIGVEKQTVRERDALEIYNELVNDGDLHQKQLGVDGLYRNIKNFSKDLGDPKFYFNSLHYIKHILALGNPEQVRHATEILIDATKTSQDAEHFPALAATFFQSSNLESYGLEFINPFLEKVRLPKTEILASWKVSRGANKTEYAVYQNLKTIIDLEKIRPGASEFLYDEFGIADFGRYPVELLMMQVDEFESLDLPYGVIIYPRNDWNGAFYEDKDVLKDFMEELQGQFSLRVAECESKMDIARILIKLNKHYNPDDGMGHKISLLILGGHGTEDSIQFGGRDERHSLFMNDLFGGGVQKTNRFFEENPTIILSSCSTGAEGGIGQELSKKFGAKVIAPKVPTNLRAIHGSKNRGQDKFRFNALYASGETTKSLYRMGQEN
ncbi:MAG: hypothetical protein WCT19_04240 [Candidatus Paceibacterota bacterium]